MFSEDLSDLLADLPKPAEEETEVKRGQNGSLVSATLSQLVRILTDEREIARDDLTDLVDTFFLFFRSFCKSPATLFDLLIQRYYLDVPSDLPKAQSEAWWVGQQCTKVHVVNMFSIWLEYYWAPATDDALLKPIQSFMFETVAKDHTLPEDLAQLVATPLWECVGGLQIVHNRWLARVTRSSGEAAAVHGPTGFEERLQAIESMLGPNEADWIDAGYFRTAGGPEMLARQLTYIETEYFHTRLPEQLVQFSNLETQDTRDLWRAFSNALTLWVAKCIVIHNKVLFRAEIMEMFIATAAACKRMRNYSSALAILHGLQMAPIWRLSQTRTLVRLEFQETFSQLTEFLSSDNNWRRYREELPQNLPAVPIMAVVTRDVAQCREALDRVSSTVGPPVVGPISLQYYRNLRRIVRILEDCYASYNLECVDLVYIWLLKQTEDLRDQDYDQYSQYLMALRFVIRNAQLEDVCR
ncbi:ras GEF [Obba rivulosa]|uniref:Ras GEF n=1 Tax=Obba rivulosa TaxID=1052685 RepID=A0A8E2B0D4_9APHY|nr:ras GEF [Obba rivulosa]